MAARIERGLEGVEMGSVERTREIRRRRARRSKIQKLRLQHSKTNNEGDKAIILAKALRVSPLIDFGPSTDNS